MDCSLKRTLRSNVSVLSLVTLKEREREREKEKEGEQGRGEKKVRRKVEGGSVGESVFVRERKVY